MQDKGVGMSVLSVSKCQGAWTTCAERGVLSAATHGDNWLRVLWLSLMRWEWMHSDCVFHLFTDSLGVLLTCSQIALHVRIKKQNIFTICVKCKHMLAYLKTKCKKAIKLKKISDVRSFDLEEDMVIRKWLVWQPVISLELWTFVVLVGRMSASKLRLHAVSYTHLTLPTMAVV